MAHIKKIHTYTVQSDDLPKGCDNFLFIPFPFFVFYYIVFEVKFSGPCGRAVKSVVS